MNINIEHTVIDRTWSYIRMSDNKESSYKKDYKDTKHRLDSEMEEKRRQLAELRKQVRHKYAVDRRKRKMDELEDDIEDAEYLYEGTDITEMGERRTEV